MARPRGSVPSPRYKLAAAHPHQIRANVPVSFGVVPKQLSVWLNDTFGDCVTAEEAFAKAAWSVQVGLPELFISDAEVKSWAKSNGVLNGAVPIDVLEAMAKSGFVVNGVDYTDGTANSVDYTNWSVLTSAIFTGPVKIGVDGDDLEKTVGNTNGWFGSGFKDSSDQNHCVSLCGYGTVAQCYQMLSMPVPSSAASQSSDQALLLFTWGTIGVVVFPSVVTITSEAWVRTPTTPQQPSSTPTPIPTPTPTVTPTPTPTSGVPSTAFWCDKPSKTLHIPTGWTNATHNISPEIVVHPNNQVVDFPSNQNWKLV